MSPGVQDREVRQALEEPYETSTWGRGLQVIPEGINETQMFR